jgi:hypothetical protein
MNIRTLGEVTTPDGRTLVFTPLGLSTAGHMAPEDAADFQQQVVDSSVARVQAPAHSTSLVKLGRS